MTGLDTPATGSKTWRRKPWRWKSRLTSERQQRAFYALVPTVYMLRFVWGVGDALRGALEAGGLTYPAYAVFWALGLGTVAVRQVVHVRECVDLSLAVFDVVHLVARFRDPKVETPDLVVFQSLRKLQHERGAPLLRLSKAFASYLMTSGVSDSRSLTFAASAEHGFTLSWLRMS